MLDLEEIQGEVNEAALQCAVEMLRATAVNYKYIAPRRDWYHEGVSHLS